MTTLEISVNADRLAETLRAKPRLIRQYLTPALDRSAKLIAREAKQNAISNGSVAFSQLVNSINSRVEASGLEAVVFTGVNYARFVEEGTKGGGYPPQQTMLDWMRIKSITPRDPDMTPNQLAYLIARKIALNGSPAKPFMKPAYDSQKAATVARINEAIRQALGSAT